MVATTTAKTIKATAAGPVLRSARASFSDSVWYVILSSGTIESTAALNSAVDSTLSSRKTAPQNTASGRPTAS